MVSLEKPKISFNTLGKPKISFNTLDLQHGGAKKLKGTSCKLKKNLNKNLISVSDKINNKIDLYKKQLEQSGKQGYAKLKKSHESAIRDMKKKSDKVKNSYLQMPWRSKRPDVTLLIEIVLAIIFMALLYKLYPYFTGSQKPGFSKEQFLKATKMSPSAFSVEEVAKVNLEVKSFQDYANYFRSQPYSLANNGVIDLLVANALFPIVLIFVQYVIPPFVIGYVIWFIIRYWPYVFRALYGLFVMLYNYFTNLVQGKLGCKWYIRFVTGWGCGSPDFASYLLRWRRTYIDRPVYIERMKYVRQYYQARRKYYEVPYRKYITIPWKRYKIKAEFAKKIYIDRAIEVFLKKTRDMYPETYRMPRDAFYYWLLGNNKNLAGVYAKMIQAKKQIKGESYKSVTASGKVCACPGTKTPISLITDAVKENKKQLSDDLDDLIDVTNQVYDKLNKVDLGESAPDCGTIDSAVNNRQSIAKYIVIGILSFIVSVMVYSNYFGAPYWIKSMFGPVNQFIYRGLHVAIEGKGYNAWIVFYGLILTTILSLMYFS